MTTIFETLQENYILFEQNIINIIIDSNDNLWFNANDLTKSLGYNQPKNTIQLHINKADKIQFQDIHHNYNITKHPNTIYINETGLYSLLIKSNKPAAKKFTAWITGEVLPSIRKFGYYKMKIKYEQDKTNLLQQINSLTKKTKTMENDLKDNKYPEGALVYIIDYSDEDKTLPGIYRLGITDNMKNRKQIYDTHTLHKKQIVHYEVINDPIRLEQCIRSMLYDYRYKSKKDFFVCPLSIIKKAFISCITMLKSMNNQTGGGNIKLITLKKKLNRLDKNIDKYDNLLLQIDD
jgi:prophage antirepressor-like protein